MMACSEGGVKAAARSRAGVEDGKRRWRCPGQRAQRQRHMGKRLAVWKFF
jgi:hypothetical protein